MDPHGDIDRIALLREPVRRKLYAHVRTSARPVSRDQAARAVGVSRSLAAFHLDRLAEAGLLEVEYRRLSGRTGRGAGRPAKLYGRTETRVAAAVPPTAYALAGDLLIEALRTRRADEGPEDAIRRASRDLGVRLAEDLRPELGRGAGWSRVRRAMELLGFEPERGTEWVRLRNCPFHELARRHRSLVCSMNRELVGTIVERLAGEDVGVAPDTEEGSCCVLLERGKP